MASVEEHPPAKRLLEPDVIEYGREHSDWIWLGLYGYDGKDLLRQIREARHE